MAKYLVLQGNGFNKKTIKEVASIEEGLDYVTELIYNNKYNGKFFMQTSKTFNGYKINYGNFEDFYYIEVIDNG